MTHETLELAEILRKSRSRDRSAKFHSSFVWIDAPALHPDAILRLVEAVRPPYGFAGFKLEGGVFAVEAARASFTWRIASARAYAVVIRYLVKDWLFDPKRPCMVR